MDADRAESSEEPQVRLTMFADRLERDLGDAATVVRTEWSVLGNEVTVDPTSPHAIGLWWMGSDSEVVLGVHGEEGGRWEFGCTNADLDLFEQIVRAVVAGRVSAVRAPGRSRVTYTLDDGRTLHETGAALPRGCIPLPFWKRWGRRVQYGPYRT